MSEIVMIANGHYTITSPRGNHRTIKVSTVLEGNLEGRRIVSVMTGPDNVFNYTGVGFVNDDDTVTIWQRKKGTDLHKTVAAFLRIIKEGVPGFTLQVSKHCIKCNRLLTTPESIAAGIGPICAQGGIDP